jgi:hypothetical protein
MPPALPVSPVVPSPPVPARNSPAPADAVSARAKAGKPPAGRRALGLGLDGGVPDGINLGLVIAPAEWVRFEAAFGTNTAGLGYRGSATFVPVGWGPSFSFEAGHCNQAATNSVVRKFFNAPKWAAPYVQELGYTYLNAHLGFDLVIGNFALFLHGGYTYLMGRVSGSQPIVVDSSTKTTATIAEDGKVNAHTLSAKLGLLYMFGGS